MAVKNIYKKMSAHPFAAIFSILLFVEIVYLIRFNLVHASKCMDHDAAKLMMHMREIVRTGKLLIPDWWYMSTHEIDSSMFLAIPFYAITGNIFLSFALSNTCFVLVLLAVVLTIFRNFSIKPEIALAAACLIFVPYNFGMLDYMNMLFIRAAQYSIKVLIPLMGIMILTFKENNRKRDIVLSAIWLFLLFLCTFSSGLLPVVSGVLPITGAYIVNIFFRKKTIGEINRFHGILLFCALAVSFIGFVIHYYCRFSSSGINATLLPAAEFGDRLHENAAHFLSLINALPDSYFSKVPLLSVNGIGYLLRFGYAVFLIICSVHFIRLFFSENKVYDDTAQEGTEYLAAVILVNLLIHLLCSYNKPRYYLIELLCMMILAGVYFSRLSLNFKKPARILTLLVLTASVFLIWKTSRDHVTECVRIKDRFGFCSDLCEYFASSGVDNVIFIDNTSVEEICRLTLPDMKFSNYQSDSCKFISYDWYKTTGERAYYGDSSLIVTQQYDSVEPIFGKESASHYEHVADIAGFKIFRSGEFCLPLE